MCILENNRKKERKRERVAGLLITTEELSEI
jgi:hypothetical protein